MTCRVPAVSREAYCAAPVSQRDWDDAHLINAAPGIHADAPADGDRFIADEIAARGFTATRGPVAQGPVPGQATAPLGAQTPPAHGGHPGRPCPRWRVAARYEQQHHGRLELTCDVLRSSRAGLRRRPVLGRLRTHRHRNRRHRRRRPRRHPAAVPPAPPRRDRRESTRRSDRGTRNPRHHGAGQGNPPAPPAPADRHRRPRQAPPREPPVHRPRQRGGPRPLTRLSGDRGRTQLIGLPAFTRETRARTSTT